MLIKLVSHTISQNSAINKSNKHARAQTINNWGLVPQTRIYSMSQQHIKRTWISEKVIYLQVMMLTLFASPVTCALRPSAMLHMFEINYLAANLKVCLCVFVICNIFVFLIPSPTCYSISFSVPCLSCCSSTVAD